MICGRIIHSLFLFGLAMSLALAQSPDAIMEQANEAYMEENYGKALELYERIPGMELESASLYHNMGNAWYQKGHLGKAILNYERALMLSPSYTPALHNLRIARSQIVNPIEEMPLMFYQRWHNALTGLLSADGWAITGIVSLFFIALCIALFVASRSVFLRKLYTLLAAVVFLVSVVAFYSAGRQHHRQHKTENVIVMEQMQHVNSAPGGQGSDLFVVYEGTKAKVLSKVESWYELRFADGNVGWVNSEALETI